MVMESTLLSQDFGNAALSKEDFDTLATGEEEANIGVSLGLLLKAGVRKFRALFDLTSLVANCYYVHTVAI